MLQLRQACKRQEKRTSRWTAQKLHSALPCTFRNGKKAENCKHETSTNGKSKIRNENMADSLGTGWRRVLHSEGFPYKKP